MRNFDFLIVGSGFSGSITGMALTKLGYSVCMLEKGKHPRFSIGESSTPIADMILRDLSDTYNLPFLKKLSRYGVWQNSYPEVTCGLKRGFSYYKHKKGERFKSDEFHNHELLVAASENDKNSDTNWLRSDVDHLLVQKAKETGVIYLDQCEIVKVSRIIKDESWVVSLESPREIDEIECDWIIDATGDPSFSNKFLNTISSSAGFKTHSTAIFTHLKNVDLWSDYLKHNGFNTSDYPYNPDFSALHHLIEEGWIWMLRFNDNRLSAGILIDEPYIKDISNEDPSEIWGSVTEEYQSLKELFHQSTFANPPGRFIQTDRLQRKMKQVFGKGWVVLPHTAGFVDPLHSTGIAFTLSGIESLLKLFHSHNTPKERYYQLRKYQDKLYNELYYIDLLVSMCYKTRFHFKLFTACTMLYFVASIQYEQKRLAGEDVDTFLCVDDVDLQLLIQKTYDEIEHYNWNTATPKDIADQVERIKKRIEPFNKVGLMDPQVYNMYRHTAVNL